MNILFIGDIDGREARAAVRKRLPELIKKHDVDLTIANIENASHGAGITLEHYDQLKKAGVDVFTSGNHIWSKQEIIPKLDDKSEPILRPANYPKSVSGKGIFKTQVGSTKVAVINLMGRVFIKEDLDDPFTVVDSLLADCKDHFVFIDFHAEATSEKRALGFYLDGRVGAVIGTHTHVPTADAQILPKGTAYLTDAGYVGPLQSILGVNKDIIIKQFLTQVPQMFETSEEPEIELNGALITATGLAVSSIIQIREIIN